MERHQGRIDVRTSRQEGHRGTAMTLFLPFENKPLADQVIQGTA
jgi:hypothetical protein